MSDLAPSPGWRGEKRAEVICEFCGTRYVVEEPELRTLLAGMGES